MAKEGKVKTLSSGARSKKESKSKSGSNTGASEVNSEEKLDHAKANEISSTENYEGQVLSKKDKRKLKKLRAKELEEKEQKDEAVSSEDEEDEEEDGADELDLERLAASASESEESEGGEDDSEEEDDEEDEEEEGEDGEEDEEDEEIEDVPLSDVEYDSDADVVPHTKLTINNTAALRDSLARIQLPWSKHSFQEHQSVFSSEKAEEGIKDIYDDTERELAFYKQALDAAKQAKANLLKLKVPFSRPMDYFAEMVKSDEHMDKLKNKLLKEAADKKASEEAKRQRQLKKFGKQVQVKTLQDRAKQKKESLEKIKSLKKKRGNNEISNDDEFQIALEEATREERGGDNKRRKPNSRRLSKDAKYGFGGKKRGNRQNDANSSADITGFSTKRMKGKSRPGKSKRSRRG